MGEWRQLKEIEILVCILYDRLYCYTVYMYSYSQLRSGTKRKRDMSSKERKFPEKRESVHMGSLRRSINQRIYHLCYTVHCKKILAVFPSPAGMSLTKLSLAGNNLIISGQGEFGK
jgi:hypothetical protein